MAHGNQEALQTFLEAWTAEFEKSVEMFTGQPVKLEHDAATGSGKTFDAGDSILWQGQIFEREESAAVWIGTPVATCTALTETSAEDSAGREALYKELLQQSLEGAAHVLSSGLTPRIVCKQAIEDGSLPPDLADVETAWLVMPGRERFPILVGVHPDFAALLREKEQRPSEPLGDAMSTPDESARLDRLVDLELPVSVVLGRAKLQIREVLKLTAGSLVELDHHVGEPVEIVVHGAVVARGEVVSVGGNYGVKIQEVISRKDRFALQSSAATRAMRVSHQVAGN